MLWPPYRRLMLHGEQGEAVVVTSEAKRTTQGAGLFGWEVTIRMKFPDGDVRDFDRYVCADDTARSTVDPGDTVPVRFDPRKHRAQIDERALRADRDARRTQRHAEQDAAVRETEARLGIKDP
jgi:hypothetical protein